MKNLEFFFQQLQSRSDDESSLLLALMRLGADVDKITSQLKAAPGVIFAKAEAGTSPIDLLALMSK